MLYAYEVVKSTVRKDAYYITFTEDDITVKVAKEQSDYLEEETLVSDSVIRTLIAILKHAYILNSMNVGKKLPKLPEYLVNSTLKILLDKFSQEELVERFYNMKYSDIVAIFKAENPCVLFEKLI